MVSLRTRGSLHIAPSVNPLRQLLTSASHPIIQKEDGLLLVTLRKREVPANILEVARNTVLTSNPLCLGRMPISELITEQGDGDDNWLVGVAPGLHCSLGVNVPSGVLQSTSHKSTLRFITKRINSLNARTVSSFQIHS